MFLDPVVAPISLKEAEKICNEMVVYGLMATYASWFGFAEKQERLRGPLQKSILFCTRILLDEKRFIVCKKIAQVAFEIVRQLNILDGREEYQGTHTIRSNLLFARRESGELVDKDIRGWDTSQIHDRYKFFQYILLRDYPNAYEIGRSLLTKIESTGRTNICIEEFNEWPILEDFRLTKEGQALQAELQE
jgi:hypothetical protein